MGLDDDNRKEQETEDKFRVPKQNTERCTVRARERVEWNGSAIGRTN